PAILQVIGDILRFEDYSVLQAFTGSEAIEIGNNRGPMSLFITDMQLPDASGIDIALNLVALYPDLPVLVISGNPMDWWASRDVSNFSRFPPNTVDFLEKPFFASELKMRVRMLIGRRTQIRTDKKNQGNQAA